MKRAAAFAGIILSFSAASPGAMAEDANCPLPQNFKHKGLHCDQVGDFGPQMHWFSPPTEVYIRAANTFIASCRRDGLYETVFSNNLVH